VSCNPCFIFMKPKLNLSDFLNMGHGTKRLEVGFFKIYVCFKQFSVWRIFNEMRRKMFSVCMRGDTFREIIYSK
jgi:hypothetical protein